VPWNRRRAEVTLLALDVVDLLRAAMAGSFSPQLADSLFTRADAIASAAGIVDDIDTVARGRMQQARIALLGYVSASEVGLAADVDSWEGRYLKALRETLAVQDLHDEATFRLAEHTVNRVLDRDEQVGDDLELGDQVQQARRRALELTRTAFRNRRPIQRQFETAVFAAFLSAAVGDTPAATEVGAIAHHLLGAIRPEDLDEETRDVAERLDGVREDLGLIEWPPAR
jgi:hypothetical protein